MRFIFRSAVVSDSCTAFMKSSAVSAFCTLIVSPSLDLMGMLSLVHDRHRALQRKCHLPRSMQTGLTVSAGRKAHKVVAQMRVNTYRACQ